MANMLNILDGRWNFRRIEREIVCNRERCVEWCQPVGLLPTRKNCPKNCGFMRIEASSSANAGVDTCIGLNFRCRKGKHGIKRTLAENTWFERRHFQWKIY